MVTIETIATVADDGTITAKAPGFVPKGKHRAVIVLEDATMLPKEGQRGFPDMTQFREKLGVAVHPGNTIIEMREDERS
jgi:hypothetical protein